MSALERLAVRGAEIGARRAGAVAREVAEAVERDVPGVAVSVADTEVTIAARGLLGRALAEPALRWIGSLLR